MKDEETGVTLKLYTRPIENSECLMIRADTFFKDLTVKIFEDFVDKSTALTDIGLVDEFKEIAKYDDGTKIVYVLIKFGLFEREAIVKI